MHFREGFELQSRLGVINFAFWYGHFLSILGILFSPYGESLSPNSLHLVLPD